MFVPDLSSAGIGFKNLTIIAFANVELLAVATTLMLYVGRTNLQARYTVDHMYRREPASLGASLGACHLVPLGTPHVRRAGQLAARPRGRRPGGRRAQSRCQLGRRGSLLQGRRRVPAPATCMQQPLPAEETAAF